jgi:hypothetical protein
MKKSRIAKLALMGASITALAATLTTSTYAWYVSNKVASVDQLAGGVSANAGDGSIGVSKTGKNGTYYPSIKLDALTASKLAPVHSTDGLNFYTLGAASNHEVTVSSTDGSGSVYNIVFYIKSDAHVTVTPTLKIVNAQTNAANLPTQIAYEDIGAYNSSTGKNAVVTGAEKGKEFTVDACRAIYASMTPTAGSFAAAASTGVEIGDFVSGGSAGATKISAPGYLGSSTFTDGVTTGDAHAYYHAVTGDTILSGAIVPSSGTGVTTVANQINATSALELQAGTPVMLSFNIWLDGGDTDCFNCCAGQNITVDFSFAVATTITA